MRSTKGFTLIELMLVVAVIAIITAIAIPSVLNAKKAGNEASAIGSMRSLTSVCQAYKVRYGHYAPFLSTLQTAGLIDELIGAGRKAGYTFTCYSGDLGCLSGTTHTWECMASPQIQGTTGDRWFRTNHNGVIEVSSDGGGAWRPLDQ